ncbi:MAG TPA: hypothetical protein VMV78_08675 [Thiobacillus sp.]|nr:hypothetical protein [Thiobacillus sp.]
MTNEQLAILLESYRRQVALAIEEHDDGAVKQALIIMREIEDEFRSATDTLRGIQRI